MHVLARYSPGCGIKWSRSLAGDLATVTGTSAISLTMCLMRVLLALLVPSCCTTLAGERAGRMPSIAAAVPINKHTYQYVLWSTAPASGFGR